MRLRLPQFAHRAEPILLVAIVLLALAGMVIVVMVVIKSSRSAELSNQPVAPPARRAALHSGPPLPPGTELGHIPDSSRSPA